MEKNDLALRVAFDLETTGTDICKDRIVSLGWCVNEERTGYWLINPTVPIPPEATEIHGITDERVQNCATFKDIAVDVETLFLNAAYIVGYNIGKFDLAILGEEFIRAWGILPKFFYHAKQVDAMKIFHAKEQRRLKDAVKFYLGEDFEGHDAREDAQYSALVTRSQLQMYGLNMEQAHELSGGQTIDPAGKIVKRDGEFYLTFGKHKDKPIKNIPQDYIARLVTADIPRATAYIIEKLRERK